MHTTFSFCFLGTGTNPHADWLRQMVRYHQLTKHCHLRRRRRKLTSDNKSQYVLNSQRKIHLLTFDFCFSDSFIFTFTTVLFCFFLISREFSTFMVSLSLPTALLTCLQLAESDKRNLFSQTFCHPQHLNLSKCYSTNLLSVSVFPSSSCADQTSMSVQLNSRLCGPSLFCNNIDICCLGLPVKNLQDYLQDLCMYTV